MDINRLSQQFEFLVEMEKLKTVLRQSPLWDNSRKEDDAQHSWHLCVYAMILQEYAEEGTDLLHCMKMALVHDMVELYAGDTYAFDIEGQKGKYERELQSAKKVFALLPKDQENMLLDLWLEFEACTTVEARFANALDRIQPMLNNLMHQGALWKENNITLQQVLQRNDITKDTLPTLWQQLEPKLIAAQKQGWLK